MVGPELESYLASIKDALVRAFSPSRIILFGSFARGDQNRASDVDLVVIADTQLAFTERIGAALQACYGASKRLPVEVLVYNPSEWEGMKKAGGSFASLIEREGRVLYEQGSESQRRTALAGASSA
jgi:predicted nucleotidyltransferase